MNIDNFESNVSRLQSEIEILRKILYRNKNQHGKTKHYNLLYQVSN